jgi:hypothetical protein
MRNPDYDTPLPQFTLDGNLPKENIGSTVFLVDATTEEIVDVLIERGYKVTLERPVR